MTQADPLALLEDALAQARRAGADAADAVAVESGELSVSQRMGKPEDLERAEQRGIALRVFCDGRLATVSSSDWSREALAQMGERAVAMARAATPDPYAGLAEPELLAGTEPPLDLCEAEAPPLEWLRAQCAEMEALALDYPGITNSEGAQASVSRSRVTLATTNGFARTYATGSCSLSISLLAGEGEAMQRDYDYATARHCSDLTPAAAIARSAAERTVRKLGPRKLRSEKLPLIFDPRVGKSLLGYFAAAINGQSVARGTSFLKEAMGERLFAPGLRIIDDPHRPRGLGSRPFDGEGLANRKRALVEDGVLTSWLLDLRSARQLQLPPTGHAVRSMSGSVSPSTSNLYLEPGTVSPQQLRADIARGIYITETFGMGVNLVTGDYSQGAAGFLIEQGELRDPVAEFTIAGHLRDMFAQLVPANDLAFRYATNAPSLRIDGMTIAGS